MPTIAWLQKPRSKVLDLTTEEIGGLLVVRLRSRQKTDNRYRQKIDVFLGYLFLVAMAVPTIKKIRDAR